MPCKMDGSVFQCLLWTTSQGRSQTNVVIRATPENIWFLSNNEEINKTWGYRLMNHVLIICPFTLALFFSSFLSLWHFRCLKAFVFLALWFSCRAKKYRNHFSSSLNVSRRWKCYNNVSTTFSLHNSLLTIQHSLYVYLQHYKKVIKVI